MLIIVGLGNPGLSYKKTYHNVGFMCVDKLAESMGFDFKKKICKAKVAEIFVKGEKIVIAKPQTYMNLSGESVKELMGYYKAKPEEVIVVYDDIDLAVGQKRIRPTGSAGTHNGMRSIVSLCGTDLRRIRVGIGRPENNIPLADFVLSKPKGDVLEELSISISIVAKALEDYIADRSIDKLGNKYNGGNK